MLKNDSSETRCLIFLSAHHLNSSLPLVGRTKMWKKGSKARNEGSTKLPFSFPKLHILDFSPHRFSPSLNTYEWRSRGNIHLMKWDILLLSSHFKAMSVKYNVFHICIINIWAGFYSPSAAVFYCLRCNSVHNMFITWSIVRVTFLLNSQHDSM